MPVRKASCVSTSITTSSAAAAKGIAKFQSIGSLNGAVFMRLATLSQRKPTRINAVCTTIAEPTRANARVFESDSAEAVLRCSVNFQTDPVDRKHDQQQAKQMMPGSSGLTRIFQRRELGQHGRRHRVAFARDT